MASHSSPAQRGLSIEVFGVFLRLGCTSFGGPVAHLGYFRREFVERLHWCSEATYAELIALAQTLPGPASSQVGFALGLRRAGWLGGLAAFAGFTLPSAVLMLALAYGQRWMTGTIALQMIHGLQLVAVAVVAQAVWSMQRGLAPDWQRLLLAALAAALALSVASPLTTLGIIVASAVVGVWMFRKGASSLDVAEAPAVDISRASGVVALCIFLGLLIMTPLLSKLLQAEPLRVLATLYRSGALVFGGGHVVLPLLEQAVVSPGWMQQSRFLSGYAAAQALPGPLFAFGGYVGASMGQSATPPASALLCGVAGLLGLFAPGLLLMGGVLPFWSSLRQHPAVSAAIRGVNAGVVGLLFSALIRPLAVTTLRTPLDWLLAFVFLLFLLSQRVPAWMLVLAVAGFALLRHLV